MSTSCIELMSLESGTNAYTRRAQRAPAPSRRIHSRFAETDGELNLRWIITARPKFHLGKHVEHTRDDLRVGHVRAAVHRVAHPSVGVDGKKYVDCAFQLRVTERAEHVTLADLCAALVDRRVDFA